MSTDLPRPDSRIAIVGVSALFPGSADKFGFWKDIYEGRDLISDVPPTHWLVEDYYDPDPSAPDKTYAKRGAFLNNVDFDALSWGIPPSILPATDTAQLLALIVANQVLEEAANGQFETMDRSRISVILGVTSAQELLATSVSRLQRPVWVKALRESGIPEDEVDAICTRISSNYTPWQESTFPGLLGNVVAGRIANRLDLGGTNCVTDAACASTFSAISMAASELMLGDSDLVITGGVDTLNDIFMFMCFSKTPALSPTGDCRPFSADGDGTMLGEGLGMIALKRLADAERDGDHIYGVIAGVGTSSDGRSKSVYAPVSEGQAKAIRRAYEKAGYSPSTVELVEAHGTGTVAGDAAEFGGLRLAFESEGAGRNWCALGSVKSQIGHTKAAAGAAGIFKSLMSLHQRVIPPTIKITAPNPKMKIADSPFYLSTHRRPWVRGSDHPRRASVSSFGFGGSNFHITLEEYRGPNPAGRLNQFESELYVACADSAEVLVKELRAQAQNRPATPDALRFAAVSSQSRYDATKPARVAVIASTWEDFAEKLTSVASRIEKSPATAFTLPDGSAFGLGSHTGKTAFIFPGQGSQYVGMGAELAMSFDVCIAPWDAAADFEFDKGVRLHDVVFPAPSFEAGRDETNRQRLTSTQWAQPAIGVASASQLALLRLLDIVPDLVGGHSFGEVTALHAAGVISQEEFVQIARIRGELMNAAAVTPGAMLALEMSRTEAEKLIARYGVAVVVANHNHPTQVVLSGETSAIDAFVRKLNGDGLDGKRLPVATAFHSPVVAASCAPFARALEKFEFQSPAMPVYSGVTAKPHAAEVANIRRALSEQIAAPIDFVGTVRSMYDAGARTFIEVGPGAVLTGLIGKILGDVPHVAVSLERKQKTGTESLLLALSRIVAAGLPMKLDSLFASYQPPRDPAQIKPARMPVAINGSNYGKPYPPVGGAAALPRPNPPRTQQTVANFVAAPTHASALPANAAQAGRQPSVPSVPNQPQVQIASAGTSNPSRPVGAAGTSSNLNSNDSQSKGSPTVNDQNNSSRPTAQLGQTQYSQPTQVVSVPAAAHTSDWLATFRETQRRTAEVQAMYQAAMAQSQAAYLQMAEASLRGLTALAGGNSFATANVHSSQPSGMDGRVAMIAPTPQHYAPPMPIFAPLPLSAPAPQFAAVAQPSAAPSVSIVAAPAPSAQPPKQTLAATPVAAVHAPAPAVKVAPPAAEKNARGSDVDVYEVMLKVVSESTGYPADMLSPEMALEGDLGIDSIKRVEILSLAQERIPGLPAVDAARMGALETLGQIVEYMRGLMGVSAAAPSAVKPQVTDKIVATGKAPAATEPPTARAAANHDVTGIMMQVVSETTGYPAEMLGLEMSLEGDLGIDSIKRVEILSLVQDRVPGMPAVDAARMGALETVGQIVQYIEGLIGASPSSGGANPAEGLRPFA